MKYFQKLGMPTNKMMLGIGTYGRGDTPAMPYTGFKGETGFVAYYEVRGRCFSHAIYSIGRLVLDLHSNRVRENERNLGRQTARSVHCRPVQSTESRRGERS